MSETQPKPDDLDIIRNALKERDQRAQQPVPLLPVREEASDAPEVPKMQIKGVREREQLQICQCCGVEFTTIAVWLFSKWVPVVNCHDCEKLVKAAKPSRTAPRGRSEAAWIAVVGEHYGAFDERKLKPEACRLLPKLLAWRPAKSGDLMWKGIGLIGDTNLGKSFMIHRLGCVLYVEGYDVFATCGVDLMWNISNLDKREAYRERCINAEILLLDDADKAKLTDAVEADFYGILEMRRRFHRPVIATVNVGGASIAAAGSEARGAPIATRLRDLCDFIQIKPDTE